MISGELFSPVEQQKINTFMRIAIETAREGRKQGMVRRFTAGDPRGNDFLLVFLWPILFIYKSCVCISCSLMFLPSFKEFYIELSINRHLQFNPMQINGVTG